MSDLEAIITGAVNDSRADLEDAGDVIDSGTTEEVITPEVSTDGTEEAVVPEVEAVEGEVKPPVVEEDAFAKEHGISPKDKSGTRDNRIPYSNVKKIVGNAEGKLAEAVLGRPLATGEKAIDVVKAHVARIPTLEAENTAYKTKLTSVDHVERIMEQEPARFLDMLVAINPAYKALIGGGGTGTPETKQVDPNAGMPQPDYDLGVDAEGKSRGKTYSQQGLIDLMKWQADQTRTAVLGEVNTTFKPVKDQMEADARVQALIPQLENAVNAARTNWKGFKENEAAILAEITAANAAKKPLSLGDAYVKVINDVHEKSLAKLTTDETAMRKKLLAEMKRAPSSTSVVPVVATSRVADTGDAGGLEAVIKKAWDDSKR